MSLPYRWYPSGTRYVARPVVGDLWPFEHAVYRVVAVTDVAESEWTDRDRGYRTPPCMVVVRPVRVTSEDVRARDHDRHFRLCAWMSLDVYRDPHYPICAECLEPLPCRDQMAARVSASAAAKMSRYELAGVCPACSEPVTSRQESRTWPENMEVLGGPPVTFHLRRRCFYAAASYERQWAAADPGNRRPFFSCGGHVINHNDGTYQCSELTECPGPQAEHPSYTVCRCPDCHARGSFGCTPSRDARNAALDAAPPT